MAASGMHLGLDEKFNTSRDLSMCHGNPLIHQLL